MNASFLAFAFSVHAFNGIINMQVKGLTNTCTEVIVGIALCTQ